MFFWATQLELADLLRKAKLAGPKFGEFEEDVPPTHQYKIKY
jgi:hypothetical protein